MTHQTEEIWEKIKDYTDKNLLQKQKLLSHRGEFYIIKSESDYIKIDKLPIRLEKNMFLTIYKHLKENKGWIKIGASRVNTDPTTIEGFIKNTYFEGNPDALSTAPWFSVILVYSNIGILFNKQQKGQAIRYQGPV